jgi:hypothetical protein
MVLSTDAPAAIEKARNSVAEALRALQDLASHPAVAAAQAMAAAEPNGDRVPVKSSGSDSRWELVGNWADYPPTTTHSLLASSYLCQSFVEDGSEEDCAALTSPNEMG